MVSHRGWNRRTASRVIVACVLVLTTGLATDFAAQASPHPRTPTAKQVQAAKAHARQVASAVTAARSHVAAAQTKLDSLNADLEILVEKWNAARAAVTDADNQFKATQAAEAAALAQAEAAQIDVDRLAVQTYQLGPDLAGGMGQWVAVVDSIVRSGGISSLTDRTADLSYMSAARRKTVTDAQLLHARAMVATQDTANALADLQSKQLAATEALNQMRSRAQAQKAEVATLNATLVTAQRQLATAQRSAASLAHARSVGLAAARARALAAARARALAQQRAHNNDSGGGNSGNSGGGSSGNNPDRHDPSVGRYPQGVSHTTRAQRLGALAYARAHIGDPYVAGYDGPHAFDCSGLTSAAYRSVGWSMIHFSQSQFLAGEKIPFADLQPGDLIFYATDPTDWHTIHHVVFYAGNGMMVEAPHTGAFVQEVPIYSDGLVPFGARP
jgi:cell wall-associated NlpC family hydrolase